MTKRKKVKGRSVKLSSSSHAMFITGNGPRQAYSAEVVEVSSATRVPVPCPGILISSGSSGRSGDGKVSGRQASAAAPVGAEDDDEVCVLGKCYSDEEKSRK